MLHSNCTDGELRTDPNELDSNVNETKGRLEICVNNVWFSIYHSSSWDGSSSFTRALACRSLGYGDVGVFAILILCYTWSVEQSYIILDATAYRLYFLDKPQLPLYPAEFRCIVSSETILSCARPYSIRFSGNEVGISCTSRTIGMCAYKFDG